jgi:hypothetical protein
MNKIHESTVAGLWRSGKVRDFTDDLGNSVSIVCPGRDSTRPGCDFQDAVILVNGQRQVGDIEVHLTTDLWVRHGHHLDPAYNGVILHAAMWRKGGLPVYLQDGRVLPTVLLGGYVTAGGRLIKALPPGAAYRCPYAGGGVEGLRGILLLEGLRRFEDKAARCASLLQRQGGRQALYQLTCRALGYAHNSQQFVSLAGLLTMEEIELRAGRDGRQRLALLMGAAGMLPSQRDNNCLPAPDDETEEMEYRWRAVCRGMGSIHWREWKVRGMRPANHPARRLAALSGLLESGIIVEIIEVWPGLLGSLPVSIALNRMEAGFWVEKDGYWERHYDFGRAMARPCALLGSRRAGEIVVNALLPMLLALARSRGESAPAEAVLNAYINCPPRGDNEITRYMRLVLPVEGATGACSQQGLMGIYHRFCRSKECPSCPAFMSRRPARA